LAQRHHAPPPKVTSPHSKRDGNGKVSVPRATNSVKSQKSTDCDADATSAFQTRCGKHRETPPLDLGHLVQKCDQKGLGVSVSLIAFR
jgi:hypothetical protein